jgi:sec-independent protein translocase protein TatC
MPVIGYEVYKFVDPALREKERSMVYPVVTSATALFAVGILFGYFVLAKFIFIAMVPFYAAVGLSPPYLIAVTDFYTIVFLCVLFSGAAFVSPVFVYLLIRSGLVTPSFFSKNRALIWAATYVVTAIITPDGGPLLDVMLFVPVITLLEISVLFGRRYSPKDKQRQEKKCPYCGQGYAVLRPFCENCGRSLG